MRSTWILVDLDALLRNHERLRGAHRAGRVMSVLKANAYGHGLLPVAHCLQAHGQRLFGVALIEEAVALRRAGIGGRILVLGPPAPGSWRDYAAHGVEMTLPSPAHLAEAARHLEDGAAGGGAPVDVHLKLDTGMGRIGLVEPDAAALADALAAARGLRLRGVYSHLADVEALGSDFSERQLARFLEFRQTLLRHWRGAPPEFHLANSAGLLRDERFHFDYARIGYAQWAPVDFEPAARAAHLNRGLEQVLTLHTRVSHVKRCRAGDTVGYSRTYTCGEGEVVATLPVGYGDGYFRALSNRGSALVGGRRAPVVGNVSMDQTTVSLGDREAALGEPVVLLGGGAGGIPVAEMAGWAGTIGYEIFTHLNPRIPRVYRWEGQDYADGAGLPFAPGP